MKHHDEQLLTDAIQAVKSAEPGPEAISSSAARIADRLGIAAGAPVANEAIESCADVRRLLGAYRAGKLSPARKLLVDAHLRDCGACLRSFKGERGVLVDWSAPKISTEPSRAWDWGSKRFGWALAVSFAVLLWATIVYRLYWEIPPGVRAEVESINGNAYLISNANDRQVKAGAELREGDSLRTGGGSRAVLKLADGSTVEVNERSVIGVDARGRNMIVRLSGGAAIVQAAKRALGHLYIRTPDCRVAVTGTVFSVDAGIKGSRVAVLEGNVHVMHAGIETLLHAGDQMATSDKLGAEPLEEQVSWSQDREKYLRLVAQLATLQHRIGQIPFPEPRYGSDLLARVPADTLFYVSIPNLGDFLSQANSIFHDQLSQSPELQQWWARGHRNNTAELDALVDKLHDVSQYLGDEVVIVGVRQGDHPGFAVLADVGRSGLDELLKDRFSTESTGRLTVFDERSLSAAADSSGAAQGGYALVRPHEAVFSNSVATLKEVDTQLNAGASGFANSDFGRQIAAAYNRGAGIILAADLHQMMNGKLSGPRGDSAKRDAMANSGLESVKYLIAEHREVNGAPENHLNLQFSGERQRIASWLAAPAPIGSLDFVSPNAALAVAALSKDPRAIADDIAAMAAERSGGAEADENEAKEEIEDTVRNELVPSLGGDFLMALDGPVLPTPSWKLVVEVRDSNQLQAAIERMVQLINEQQHGQNAHPIAIQASQSGGRTFYSVRDNATGSVVAQYTFADGFLIVTPNRALLVDALREHSSGDTLARSASFKGLLPKDGDENCSAVAYQNLSPVLNPLLGSLSGDTAQMLRKLAADSRPTAICAWGEENRIEAGSDSRLFGFDFLTLGAVLDSRNKSAMEHVRE
jgi:FecR protein/Putative zinc-finger